MSLNTELGIHLCRYSPQRRMSRKRKMRCSPRCGVRYCSAMVIESLLFGAEVPVVQVWKESSSPRQR